MIDYSFALKGASHLTEVVPGKKMELPQEEDQKLMSPTGKTDEYGESSKEVERQRLDDLVKEANELVKGFTKDIRFEIYEDTKDLLVKVIDAKTEEVMRVMPFEKILELRVKIKDTIGIFFDEQS